MTDTNRDSFEFLLETLKEQNKKHDEETYAFAHYKKDHIKRLIQGVERLRFFIKTKDEYVYDTNDQRDRDNNLVAKIEEQEKIIEKLEAENAELKNQLEKVKLIVDTAKLLRNIK